MVKKICTSTDIWNGSLGLASLPTLPSRRRKYTGYQGGGSVRGFWWQRKPCSRASQDSQCQNTNTNRFAFVQGICKRFPSEVRGSHSASETFCSQAGRRQALSGTTRRPTMEGKSILPGCDHTGSLQHWVDMPWRACLKRSQGHSVPFC